MYLILMGKLPKPWVLSSTKTIQDYYGNQMQLVAPTTISLFFSFLSMMKAVYTINIIPGIHFKV